MQEKLLDEYTIVADKVPAKVKIVERTDKDVPLYEIMMPSLGPGTEVLLEELKDVLAEKVPIDIESVADIKKIEEMKHQFFLQAREVIKEQVQDQDKDKIDILAGIMLHRMYGLGFIDVMLADNFLEELAVNGSDNGIAVYHKKHGWCKTTVNLKDEEEIFNLSSQIGRKIGREINSLNPIMDAHLLSGDRVASTLFPITTAGNTITIRRFARNPWTIVHLISPEYNTMSKEIAAFLWQALQYELNVLVSGGTASGKTSVLSALCSLVPPNQRIISIEDTREISLPSNLHWNWVPMTSRNANPENQGEVTMLDLMVASLRMRPDRIIVGEVRRKAQAETMFEAMHTGHSVYTTFHADTVEQVKRRLTEPPLEIPPMELESLHLILVQYRDRRKGVRKTLELAELQRGGEEGLQINYLYRWHPRQDIFEKANDSIRVMEDLNLHTGMTQKEIQKDLKDKEAILEWMLKNDIKDIEKVGKVLSIYYKNPSIIIDAAINNKDPSSIIG